ncbi:MAG TPA: GGDEF domain-containing protein [Candidatus Saccharimonadales bacterium]|nr:GGDEF domain-containing protein [Candidatus Saccharimonadales bacterium]
MSEAREIEYLRARLEAAESRSDRYRAERDRYRTESLHDPLTNLWNRRAFKLAEIAALSMGFAVVLLDVDDFKEVNDELGYAVGDELLVQTAHLIRREATRLGYPTSCRIGGDEFAVYTSSRDAKKLLYRVMTMAVRVEASGRKLSISGGSGLTVEFANQDLRISKQAGDLLGQQLRRKGLEA